MTRSLRRAAWALGLAAALAGCSSDKPKPTPLEPLQPRITARPLWQARLSGVGFPLATPERQGVFHVAGNDGTVLALRAEDGREAWRVQVGATLSAGVGSDGRFTSVVTRGNEVVTIEGGQVRWRQRVPARVVTAPLVAGERVFVLGVDRAVHAFDALDGRRLWTLQKAGDPLTLAQSGVLAAFKDTLLVGQGPRLTGVDPLRGTIRWEVSMAAPRGSNEVERLADLVGPVVRDGDRVCARAFQAAVACADAERGSLLWTRNAQGLNGIGGDAQVLVGADGSDRITAWKAATGDLAWSNEKLLYRGLSGATVVGSAVVFGDAEGQLHVLSAATGEFLARLPTDGSPVIGTPSSAGQTLLVATRNGGLFAFRLP